MINEPVPPFPPQHQKRPGIEARMSPQPNFEGAEYRPADKLKGKVALISGGDSGIGRSTAVLFAREGAKVVILHLAEEQVDADTTLQHIHEIGQEALALVCDVRDPDACRTAVEEVVRTLGSLDILVNNAAWQQRQSSLADLTDKQLERTFATNVLGMFYLSRAALEHIPKGGCIINTGSITGLEGSEDLLDYSATKGAIHAFTKSLARNLVDKGIRVNCVSPGPVWTPLNVADKPAKEAGRHGMDTPYGRPAQPEEIAPAFVFFASNADSSYITGEVLTLLGGNVTAA
ncbi:MAG: SDR family oxidoreductase [Gemmatimonadaceae bacterium]|nr:SDR family oxidoreductase [Gemmatimonadaceae bacterium]